MNFYTDLEELLARSEIAEKKNQVKYIVWFACD